MIISTKHIINTGMAVLMNDRQLEWLEDVVWLVRLDGNLRELMKGRIRRV